MKWWKWASQVNFTRAPALKLCFRQTVRMKAEHYFLRICAYYFFFFFAKNSYNKACHDPDEHRIKSRESEAESSSHSAWASTYRMVQRRRQRQQRGLCKLKSVKELWIDSRVCSIIMWAEGDAQSGENNLSGLAFTLIIDHFCLLSYTILFTRLHF